MPQLNVWDFNFFFSKIYVEFSYTSILIIKIKKKVSCAHIQFLKYVITSFFYVVEVYNCTQTHWLLKNTWKYVR